MASLGSGGTRIALPRADWYLARESRDVGRRPVSRTVLDTPLVDDHVALGSDFDGAVRAPFDASRLDVLTQAMLDAGLTETTVQKILGANVVRLLRQVLP